MKSGRLSIGPVQEQFEHALAARVERQYGVACSSGTAGLHMAMLALGIKPGDEVITTPFSFIASANAILFVGARPVFVDICPKTLNMDPSKVEAAITPRTRAILAVETFGNPAYMDQYEQIAAKHDLPLVEDCCEALGCSLRKRPCGSFGRVSVFGFYPNKQITTGEGGMVVTDDKRIADMCRSLRSQGRPLAPAPANGADKSNPQLGSPSTGAWLQHDRLGYNYRMSEINAAIGLAQLQRLDEMIGRRQAVVRAYTSKLLDNANIILPTTDASMVMSWFVYVVRLATSYTRAERDRIIAGMRRHDVGAADYFPCIHLQPFYREQFGYGPGSYPIAESVAQRTIALPFFNQLSDREIDFVSQTLALMLDRENLSRG